MGSGQADDWPVTACPDCDLLQREPLVPRGASLRCVRCNRVLRTGCDGLERAGALVLAALILFVVAHTHPVIALEHEGTSRSATVVGAAVTLWSQGQPLVALTVVWTALVAPAGEMLCLLAVVPPFRRWVPVEWQVPALRGLCLIRPWDMVEVLVLAVLVSLVKLTQMASVIAGVGLWSFALVMFLLTAVASSITPRDLWRSEVFQRWRCDRG